MHIKINGAAVEAPDNSSIKDVLIARNIPLEVAIVEVNADIVRRENWQDVILSPDDDMEIIRIIGGG